MLKLDEEEILKSLLKLQEKQGTNEITGSFEDLPVKYQICYKEILDRLEAKNIISNFSDFYGENFVLTLTPSTLQDISADEGLQPTTKNNVSVKKDNVTSKEQEKTGPYNTIAKRIKTIEAIIEKRGGKDKEMLKELMEEIKEQCENLRQNQTILPRKTLIKKIVDANIKHPWIYSEASKLFGYTVMEIMAKSTVSK